LNAELKLLLGIVVGEDIFGAAMGAGGLVVVGDVVEAQPPKSSLLNRSAGIFAAGLGTGGGAGAAAGAEGTTGFWANEKSNPPVGWRGVAFNGCGAGSLLGAMSKKLPPLSGGGDVTWGADGVALAGMAVGKLKPENPDEGDCTGGDFAVEADDEKLRPPKASARPPNASFCCAGGEDIPPNDGCRSCVGWAAGWGFGTLA